MPATPEKLLVCRHGCCWGHDNAEQCDLCPLVGFYESARLTLPRVERIVPADVPEPYHRLLVHENDMTSTLEKFHGATTHLRVLRRSQANGIYQREVVLALDGTGQPVEFGAIAIHLEPFDSQTQAKILEAKRPLGAILQQSGIEFTSRPKAFVRLLTDPVMNEVLGLRQPHFVYGRCNALHNASGQTLADIVEILPPMESGRYE